MKRDTATVVAILSSFLAWMGLCMGLSIAAGTGFMVMFWFWVFLGIMALLAVTGVIAWKYLQ